MLKEQIKIIKEAEEQAEKIIQEGKNKASVITNSLNDKIEVFITLQEDFLKNSITEYSKTKSTDTAKPSGRNFKKNFLSNHHIFTHFFCSI